MNTGKRLLSIVLLTALAVLGMAFAAQAETLRPKVDNFILFFDHSGSMVLTSPDWSSLKLKMAKETAIQMNTEIPALNYQSGVNTFAPFATQLAPTGYSKSAVATAVNSIDTTYDPYGRITPMGFGLDAVDPVLGSMKGRTALIIFTDGNSNYGNDPVAEARMLYNKYPDLCIHVVSYADKDHGKEVVAQIRALKGCTVVGDPLALEKWRARGVSVLYGDMSDPELLDQLPLDKVHWVASTVRARDLNLATLSVLKLHGYEGKVALTAVNQEEAELYEKAGAHVVFRPFIDAAEQAADALTHAMGALPTNIDWPVAFKEARLRSGSAFAGYKLMDIPLRTATGVSVLAVSRAGQLNFDPGPEYLVYPGDRLLLMGEAEGVRQAEKLLDQPNVTEGGEEHFAVTELDVSSKCRCVGNTLTKLKFRQRYGVTVAFIHREGNQFVAPQPDEILRDGDRLIVIGSAAAVEKLKEQENL